MHPGAPGATTCARWPRSPGFPASRVDEVLDLVEMRDAADRRAGGYSTGMRQRLGLAATLLGDPEVLILDEPANGLDPQGIRWLRDFLRGAAAEGRTVLVSSHVLSEVEQTVDDVVVIHRGRLVKSGPIASLVAGTRRAGALAARGELAAALEQRRGRGARRTATLLARRRAAAPRRSATLAFEIGAPLHELAARGRVARGGLLPADQRPGRGARRREPPDPRRAASSCARPARRSGSRPPSRC